MSDDGDDLTVEALRAEAEVPLPPGDAFDLFVDGFARWWPREFSWSGADALEDIGIEPGLGRFLYERGPHGLRLDWGRVVEWEPPRRLGFTWQIGPDRVPVPDPDRATGVVVDFEPAGSASTTVVVVHRGWERHGEAGRRYRDDFRMAWPYALERLAAAAGPRT